MSEFKDCPRCGRNHRHLKYCGWDVGKLKDHTANLERQLEEARRESDYLTRGIQVRDKMIKGLQEECVKLHLQLPIKPFTIQLKEQGENE